MVLLFVLLCLKVIKLDQVQDAADFLLSIMTVMFVPVGASLITKLCRYKKMKFSVFSLSLSISTVVCFLVTGKVAQRIIDKSENNGKEEK